MTTAAQSHEQEDLRGLVNRLAGVVSSAGYPAGDRAALKRYTPGGPLPLAFYRLWLIHLGRDLPADIIGWATIAFGLAHMGPEAHQPGLPLGRVLAEAGYSETRLEKLLASRDDVRVKLFANLVRFLGAKGMGFDWTEAAQLLLIRDEGKREDFHRRLAKDYFHALSKKSSDAKEE
ncbi:MAG TPA: type I-E CRISPR-associated protein Cse2/CasB [Syntrophales bacterium]|nr:type I-E CRISPR-associated protein Cse2/CasB [Syntrophales bacterium]